MTKYDNHSAARILMIFSGVFVPVSLAWTAAGVVQGTADSALVSVAIAVSMIGLTLCLSVLHLKLSFIGVTEDGIVVRAWPRAPQYYTWAELQEVRTRGRAYIVFTERNMFTIRPLERADLRSSKNVSPAPIDELITLIKTRAPQVKETASRLHIDLGKSQNTQ